MFNYVIVISIYAVCVVYTLYEIASPIIISPSYLLLIIKQDIYIIATIGMAIKTIQEKSTAEKEVNCTQFKRDINYMRKCFCAWPV